MTHATVKCLLTSLLRVPTLRKLSEKFRNFRESTIDIPRSATRSRPSRLKTIDTADTSEPVAAVRMVGGLKGLDSMQVYRAGPLAWAQHMFWFYNHPYFFEDWGSEPRISRDLRLPGGASIANLEAALAASIERHEALRTVYECPSGKPPRQLVLADCRPTITMGSPDEVRPVSIFDRPGFRCQATMEGSTVLSATLVANQIDLDGASMAMAAREVENALALGGRPEADVACGGTQPVDLAELELGSNSNGERYRRHAVQHFQQLRRHAPRNFLPALSWKYGSGSTRSVSLVDETLIQAARSVAGRCRITVPSLFHAAICKVVSDWTRTPRFLFSTAVANRWSRTLRDYVGRLASTADCQFELAPDDTYRSVLMRTHKALISAYLFASHDFGEITMAGVRADEDTGSGLAKPILIEYLDYVEDFAVSWPDGHVQTTVDATRNDHLWFNIAPYRNTTSLNVNSDADLLSETDAVGILRQLADFIRQADERLDHPVRRPGDRTGAWGGKPRTRWLDFGASRFSANHIEANIEQCDGVSRAAVFTDDADALVAYVAGTSADLVEIHERLLVETSHDPLVKVPSLYILTAEAPTSEPREAAWNELAAVDRFEPSKDYPTRVSVDERFEMLKQAFIECIQSIHVDPTKSYGALGGGYLMISGMTELLHGYGYTGLDPGDFLGLGSMASIAKRLRPVVPQ